MTTPDIQSLVERVLRLDKEATKGPWRVATNRHPTTEGLPWGGMEAIAHPAGGCGSPPSGMSRITWSGKKGEANAGLIATYRTAAPILATELIRLRAEPRCEHCGGMNMVLTGCPRCGAPQCCQTCCQIATLENDVEKLRAELAEEKRKVEVATKALDKISKAEPEPFKDFPADWKEQIAACPECQGWAKNHPIQNGICDLHRKPLWARERHEKHEEVAMRYRHERTAKDAIHALAALTAPSEKGETK